jgi:SAM-dependent methyltransferase
MNELNPSATPPTQSNPRHRFCERALDYAKYRPDYPPAAIDAILEGLCSSSSPLIAADIGAGTGIGSRQLAERSVHVLAIEPDPAMRQAATSHPLVEFREGTAEATNLPDASVDLVTCFQSFHWFHPRQSLQVFHRILKPSGRLVLVWNHPDRSDEFTASCIRLVGQVLFPNPLTRFMAPVLNLGPSGFIKHGDWLRWRFLHYLPNFVSLRRHRFTFKHQLELSGLIGLAMSQSITPLSGSAPQQLASNLKQLYERSCPLGGFVDLAYRTSMYLAEPMTKDK